MPAERKPLKTPRDRSVFTSPRIRRLQLAHFLAFDIGPLVAAIAAVALWPLTRPSALDLALFLLLWAATGLAITVGYHRRFSHSAFQCRPAVDAALVVCASMAARGPMFSWAAMHRRHHELSDRPGDLHSPHLYGESGLARLRGFWHAHFAWMARHDYPNAAYYIPDLLESPHLLRWNRRYYACVVAGLAGPAAVGALATGTLQGAALALLWGGLLRMFVVAQTMNAINSLAHLVGDRPFAQSRDFSRNLRFASLATWGEAWHNNHHAFPWSAAFGFGARQPDPGLWLIRALERLGLASDVKVPDAARIAARRGDLAPARSASEA